MWASKAESYFERTNRKQNGCMYRGRQCGATIMVVTTNSCDGLWVIYCRVGKADRKANVAEGIVWVTEQKSSQAFRTKCLQTYVCGLEMNNVSFFVKQFILRLFLWNVNCPLWISVYFLGYHGCRRPFTVTPSCLLSMFSKSDPLNQTGFTTDAIFCVTLAMTWLTYSKGNVF